MGQLLEGVRDSLQRLDGAAVLDILIITALIFGLLMALRGTTAMTLLRGGFVIVLLIFLLGRVLDLSVVNFIIRNSLPGLVLGVIVIFQPEIRRALERAGRTGIRTWLFSTERTAMVETVATAVMELSRRRHGAIIVLERTTGLEDYIESGVRLDADLSPELKAKIVALPASAWQPFRQWKGAALVHRDREWAEVEFTPDHASTKKYLTPDRYLVIRAHLPQGELFADGATVHYYATVTNRWDWDGERLLRWSHERCGTVEPAHDVLKNELGGGVLPSYRFGANAAWWQLVVLTHNLLSVLKRVALPQTWATFRPRRLRFLLFHVAGRLVRHGRRLVLRLARAHPGTEALVRARAQLFAPAT